MMKCKFVFLCIFLSIVASGVRAQTEALQVVPKPQTMQVNGGAARFEKRTTVFADPLAGIDMAYWTAVLNEMGIQPKWVKRSKNAAIRFNLIQRTNDKKDESYTLQVEQGKHPVIAVTANGSNGLLYGLQTLRQLVSTEKDEKVIFPVVSIVDKPAFPWRAFMLDESRHFQGKALVKQLLDEMARLKLNTFHWHLVDDPAWRLEIKKYPRLTAVASKGDYGHMTHFIQSAHRQDSLFLTPPAQFYTQDEIREIVSYAHSRGIIVVPEVEVPGHATASIFAYPWLGATSKVSGKGVHGDLYDVTDPKVEQFLHDVLDEVVTLFPDGIIHIGGDEADYRHWKESGAINQFMKTRSIPTYADLQVWAINRMSKYIASKGYRMIGWNEITGDNIRGESHIQAGQSESLAPGTIVQFWDGSVQLVNKAIAKGYDVVNSERHFTYLDYGYETTSFKKAYSFEPIPPGIAVADQKKIRGVGCQMWGEFTPTAERVYYQPFPRIAAFAEIGWVPQKAKTSYEDFRRRLTTIEEIWKAKGYITTQAGKY